MRAAVYARLSRPKDKAELGANIGDQRSKGEELVERRGWQHVGTFTDDGRGAYRDDAKRPAWEDMLAAKPDVIVVRDVERLGRHPREYVALLDSKAKVVEWLDEDTAEVRWEAEPVNPDTDEFQQKTVGARSYSRKIGSKVKRKIRVKAAEGAWPHGGTRPFGYHHPPQCCPPGTDGCAPGVIIENEAEVIQEVAERWLAGEGLSALCRDLDARGVKTPAGKPWQYTRLRQMLAGPRIAGIRTYNGVETKGQWKAIVDEDLHRRLATAASNSMVKRAAQNGSYALTGLIECGNCGKPMYGHRQHSKGRDVRLRYVCREGCGKGIALPHTERHVSSRSFLAILAPELRDRDEARRDAALLGEQVADLEARVRELDDAYWQERTITKDRWLEQSQRFQADLQDAQKRLAESKQRVARERDVPETAEELSTRWRDADPKERNRLLRVAVDRIAIHPATKTGAFDPTRVAIHFHDGRVDRVDAADVVVGPPQDGFH